MMCPPINTYFYESVAFRCWIGIRLVTSETYQLAVTSYELPVTSYKLQVTSYELPVTSAGLDTSRVQ